MSAESFNIGTQDNSKIDLNNQSTSAIKVIEQESEHSDQQSSKSKSKTKSKESIKPPPRQK